MTQYKKFLIDHIDPLGQGVFKEDDQVYFIAKTLPGEEGLCEIYRSSKGVHFAQVKELSVSSDIRQKSVCPHYDNCGGCSYLHTDHQNELDFKLKSFERMISQLEWSQTQNNIKVISNHKRFGYRNRVQLHYDKKSKKVGYKKGKSRYINPIQNCLLAQDSIQNKIKELSKNNSWLKLVPKNSPSTGHLELYSINDEVQLSWNKDYAQGGFTQVNQEVNGMVLEELQSVYPDKGFNVIDLFGGNGNLSSQLNFKNRIVADIYQKSQNEFININLFNKDALETVQNQINFDIDLLILDPPRSGFKEFAYWSETLKPKNIFYLSCNPHTLFRDLKLLKGYGVQSFYLIDFFPGTYHFEAAIALKRD